MREIGIYLRDILTKFYKVSTHNHSSFSFGFRVSNASVLGILKYEENVLSDAILKKSANSSPSSASDHQFQGYDFVNDLLDSSAGYPTQTNDIFAKEKAYTELILKNEATNTSSDKYTVAWESFKHQAKHFARFFEMPGHERAKLHDTIKPWLERLKREMPVATTMYRSRIKDGMADQDRDITTRELGPAPLERVTNNRMSPAGISYTYLADEQVTSIAEIRPNVGDHVWSGCFSTIIPLTVIDLSDVNAFQKISIFDPAFTPDMKRVPAFLKAFALEISKPVAPEASALEYVPSQMVCEYIRSLSYHGVSFRSSLFAHKDLTMSPMKRNYVLFCGPPLNTSNSPNLPLFTNWLQLTSWVGHTVVEVSYKTYMPTGAHGGGSYRIYN